MQRKSTVILQFQMTQGACGRAFKPLQATSQHDRRGAVSPPCQKNSACFEAQIRKMTHSRNDQTFCLSTEDVKMTLHRVNLRKAMDPENILDRVLQECASQLVDSFTDIFNISLSSAVVPECLKTTKIISTPVCLHKKNSHGPQTEHRLPTRLCAQPIAVLLLRWSAV